MNIFGSIKKLLAAHFIFAPVIAILALIVAVVALYLNKGQESPVEQAAEKIIDVELGLPPGTVDLTKELKKS